MMLNWKRQTIPLLMDVTHLLLRMSSPRLQQLSMPYCHLPLLSICKGQKSKDVNVMNPVSQNFSHFSGTVWSHVIEITDGCCELNTLLALKEQLGYFLTSVLIFWCDNGLFLLLVLIFGVDGTGAIFDSIAYAPLLHALLWLPRGVFPQGEEISNNCLNLKMSTWKSNQFF
jgi:hypothetical protein